MRGDATQLLFGCSSTERGDAVSRFAPALNAVTQSMIMALGARDNTTEPSWRSVAVPTCSLGLEDVTASVSMFIDNVTA